MFSFRFEKIKFLAFCACTGLQFSIPLSNNQPFYLFVYHLSKKHVDLPENSFLMTRRILLFCLWSGFSAILCGQNIVEDSLSYLFNRQLSVFPQEKIYIHTDKPYYITGEKIWFRAYLAVATSHVPIPVSQFIYVELINPADSIISRIKIRNEENAYHGYLLIPDDVPEGDYTMRAYTSFMCSLDENYFFTKTIRIGDPQARAIYIETKFDFVTNRRINARFFFSNVSPPGKLVPQSFKISINDGKPMTIKVDDDGFASVNFDLPASSRKRVMLLEAVAYRAPYQQFILIPTPDDDFDVTFYPEGGSLMQGTSSKAAFKAMKSNGQAINISGTVYDQNGTEIIEFKSDYLGMGSFSQSSEKGKTYYAVCQNEKGQSKRFNLPTASDHGYALSVSQMRSTIYVSVLTPAEVRQNDDLYLLAHTRGIVHFVIPWDQIKNIVSLSKDQFPSGVLHLILFDANMNPVSERLIFVNNADQAQVSYQHDKENYAARSLVKNTVAVADNNGTPLTGSFSVAVTSNKEVIPDSTTNILTQLLLASDLRGRIENPAFYFQNGTASAYALDLLMRIQGWRRYNITELAHGRFSRPTSPLEIGSEISGTVKSLLLGKPVEDLDVTAIELKGSYFDNTKTDKDGRFYFRGVEIPESTRFLINAIPKRGMTRMELIIDQETFPKKTISGIPSGDVDKYQFALYADKAEQKYTYEGGIRVIQLSEVTVSAERKPPRKSPYYSSPNNSITEEDMQRFPVTDLRQLLMRIPGVLIQGKNISIRGNTSPPLLLIDDVPMDIEDIDIINVYDVAQVDVLKDAGNTAIFGSRGANGVIVIFTKDGNINKAASKPFNIKPFSPLGFQMPAEFYAPKYDTPEKQRAQTPDLRTTIHWQPVVQTDSIGVASFEFYTADEQTSYTVIIEGLADDGRIIRHERKLWRKND